MKMEKLDPVEAVVGGGAAPKNKEKSLVCGTLFEGLGLKRNNQSSK